MIEIIKHPQKSITRSIETVYFPDGKKAYAIFENNVAKKWLFAVNEDGTLERF